MTCLQTYILSNYSIKNRSVENNFILGPDIELGPEEAKR